VNPLSKASAQVGKVALQAVDYVVANRFADAEALVTRARAAKPHGSRTDIAEAVIKRVATEMAGVGAVSGAVAAAPAIGTMASMATGLADVGLAFARIATMVMAVGIAYGHDLSDLETRRHWVYDVLGGAGGQMTAKERKAGDMKKQLGQQALGAKATGTAAMSRVNEAVGARLAARLVETETLVRVATLIPLGIGAGVGAVGNRAMVNSVGRHAKKFFDTWPKAEKVTVLRSVKRS
jgi:EcsC protein family